MAGVKASVTIVIVNWNSGQLLYQCLLHCIDQSVQAEAIVVVDNASQDDSLAGVEALPGVAVMRMERNLGFAAGNNRAIAACASDWVVLLNPDAFPEREWLAALLAAAANRPDVAAFGSRQMQYGLDDVLDGIGDCYSVSGQVRRDRYQMSCRPEDLVAREIFSPCAAAAMYRTDVLRQSGGFDESFFCYSEDVDLGFRLRLLGHRAWYVPDAVVHHMGSATTGGQHGEFATYHGHRNVVWVFVKNMPGALFWALLPLHLAFNLASVVWLLLRRQGSVVWRAKRDALKGLPRAWQQRRDIGARREASLRDIWSQLDKRLLIDPRQRSAVSPSRR